MVSVIMARKMIREHPYFYLCPKICTYSKKVEFL
jgi:hypothetical protein